MPINTQFGTLSIGRDVSIDLVLPSGQPLTLTNVTSFDAKPKQKHLESKALDGFTRYGNVMDGWQLSLTMDRENRAIDDFFAAVEDGYYAGRTVQNVTIVQTIQEPDGSLSVWRFEGVSLYYDDAGSWKADAFVPQKLGGNAARRVRVQ